MPWLLIDNSNTRTKFALGDGHSLLDWRSVMPTVRVDRESLDAALGGVEFSAVVISSVVPACADVLARYFGAVCPVHFVSHSSPLGMEVDYPEPSTIGADRLANAAGVLARHGSPAIVIDLGTATTFDVVSARPAYLGGVIAPGLGVVSGYLPGKAALLPAIELSEPVTAIGKSTVHAMQVGAVIGYRGLVREIIARLRAEMDGDVKVVATGGDAAVVACGLPEIAAVNPDITLEGMRRVAMACFT